MVILTRILPLKIILPSDVVGFLLSQSGAARDSLCATRFEREARKLLSWGLKSAGLNACDYFLFAFAVFFVLCEYRKKGARLRRLVHFLVHEYLPEHLTAELELDFDSLFEKRLHSQEK